MNHLEHSPTIQYFTHYLNQLSQILLLLLHPPFQFAPGSELAGLVMNNSAPAVMLACYMQHRNHATLLLHATLIFLSAIGQYTTHPDLSSRYAVTIWNQ
jgi:hypothetical protein